MSWKRYVLPNVAAAVAKLELNLAVGAESRVLKRALVNKFRPFTGGSWIAIGLEGMNLSPDWNLGHSPPYDHGKLFRDVYPVQVRTAADSPRAGLAQFVKNYLDSSKDAVAVSDFGAVRGNAHHWQFGEVRVGYFGDEAYPLLTQTANVEAVERGSMVNGKFEIGVCSRIDCVPDGDQFDLAFFESLANGADHIFGEAFDGDGFFIWTPNPR